MAASMHAVTALCTCPNRRLFFILQWHCRVKMSCAGHPHVTGKAHSVQNSATAVERLFRLSLMPANLQPCMRDSLGMRWACVGSPCSETLGAEAVCAPGGAEGHQGHSRELQLLEQLHSLGEELVQRLSSRIAVRPKRIDLHAAITSLLCRQAMRFLACKGLLRRVHGGELIVSGLQSSSRGGGQLLKRDVHAWFSCSHSRLAASENSS